MPLRLAVSQQLEDGLADRFALYHLLECLSLRLIDALAGQEAGLIQLILRLADGSILEMQRQPLEALRDNLTLLRLLRQMLDALPVHAPVVDTEVRLSAIQARKPVQLSLFGEKKPVRNLQDYLPEWASHHRAAQFYRLSLHNEVVLDERLEKLKIEGA